MKNSGVLLCRKDELLRFYDYFTQRVSRNFQTGANAAKAILVFRAPEELPQREAANTETGIRRHVCG